MRVRHSALVVAFATNIGCGGETGEYSIFRQRLEHGATCAELFQLRNSTDPKSAVVAMMNRDLREIGCNSSSSVRREEVSPASPQVIDTSITSPTATFTVREYRIYRAIIDAPMSIPEERTVAALSELQRIPPADVKQIAKKVQGILHGNRWYGTTQSEIRHASDWRGEAR